MAVSSLMKSGGIAALAVGLAMSLSTAASAQEQRGGLRALFDQAQTQPQAEARSERQAEPRRQRDGDRSSRRDDSQADRQQNQQQRGERPAWVGQSRGGDQRGVVQNGQRNWNGNNQVRGDGNRWQNDRDGQNRNWQNRNGQSRNWSGNNNTRRWDNNWRRDNRYNWSSYRNSNRDVFRGGRYSSPYRNWSYRPLSIGFRLQPLFYSNNYWINDPGYYRLPEAYGPYRWVRYYDDALLVDVYSGEVVDVINNFFW